MNTLTHNLLKKASALILSAAILLGQAFADQEAEKFVTDILEEAAPSLTSDDQAVIFTGIENLVDQYVDIRRVGLFTLGQYARQTSPEQRAEFLELFRQYATLVYQNSLSEYTGQTLEVVSSIDRSQRDIIVNSKVAGSTPGQAYGNLQVHWRVYRSRDGAMSIVDAGANDIWLAIEQRSQFTSIIANNGGGEQGVQALINQLREQVGG